MIRNFKVQFATHEKWRLKLGNLLLTFVQIEDIFLGMNYGISEHDNQNIDKVITSFEKVPYVRPEIDFSGELFQEVVLNFPNIVNVFFDKLNMNFILELKPFAGFAEG